MVNGKCYQTQYLKARPIKQMQWKVNSYLLPGHVEVYNAQYCWKKSCILRIRKGPLELECTLVGMRSMRIESGAKVEKRWLLKEMSVVCHEGCHS
jgi:hypothetical protein